MPQDSLDPKDRLVEWACQVHWIRIRGLVSKEKTMPVLLGQACWRVRISRVHNPGTRVFYPNAQLQLCVVSCLRINGTWMTQ